MSRFDRLVVPVDRSEASLRALPVARTIADFVGSDLTVATVVARSAGRTAAEEDLRRRIVEVGVPVDEVVVAVDGFTVGQGLAALLEQTAALVVVATDGHSRTIGVTGSVAEELIHANPEVPTLLVGPRVDVERFDLAGPMVVCRDPEGMAPTAEEAAGVVARRLLMAEILVSVVRQRRTASTGQRSNGASPDAGPTVLHGSDRSGAIIDFAEEVGASIVAVGTRRRDGLSRLLLGSVAIRTVTLAHCPVLAVSH